MAEGITNLLDHKEIKRVTDYIDEILKFHRPGAFYRGESKRYKEIFLPSICRAGHNFADYTALHDSCFTVGELKSLEHCQELFQEGKLKDRYFEKIIDVTKKPIDLEKDVLHWAALAQHYNNNQIHPTRLIDITSDPLVALYFAVSSNYEDDGFVYSVNSGLCYNDFSESKFIRGKTYFDIINVDEEYTPTDETITIVKIPFPNQKIEAQRGAFGWVRKIGNKCNFCHWTIKVLAKNKNTIIGELDKLNYNKKTLLIG